MDFRDSNSFNKLIDLPYDIIPGEISQVTCSRGLGLGYQADADIIPGEISQVIGRRQQIKSTKSGKGGRKKDLPMRSRSSISNSAALSSNISGWSHRFQWSSHMKIRKK
jgi:hypothetical protein